MGSVPGLLSAWKRQPVSVLPSQICTSTAGRVSAVFCRAAAGLSVVICWVRAES